MKRDSFLLFSGLHVEGTLVVNAYNDCKKHRLAGIENNNVVCDSRSTWKY